MIPSCACEYDGAPGGRRGLDKVRSKIEIKQQSTISGKTNRLVNQESRENYGDEAAEGAIIKVAIRTASCVI